MSSMRAAAAHVQEVLREAQSGDDGGAWLVDIFCEEWEQHKAINLCRVILRALPCCLLAQAALLHLPDFFADARRLVPAGEGRSTGGRRPSLQRFGLVSAQHAVRSLFLSRRLARGLQGSREPQQPGQLTFLGKQGNKLMGSSAMAPLLLKHCLTHTGGFSKALPTVHPLSSFRLTELQRLHKQICGAGKNPETLREAARNPSRHPQIFGPGDHFNYCGVGSQLVARAVEEAFGMSISEF
eukprot:g27312.t2